jgi:phage I-like protein
MDALLHFGSGIVNVRMTGEYTRQMTVFTPATTDGVFIPAQSVTLEQPTAAQIVALIEALAEMKATIAALDEAF